MTNRGLDEPVPTLGSRFEWIRHLGRGGHGRVDLVHDRTRNERVALKLLEAPSSSAAALKREFRWLRDVVHPNLVAMFELVIEPELECLVLEYIDGVDLLDHLAGTASFAGALSSETVEATGSAHTLDHRGTAAAPERLLPALLQIVDALSFLEEKGLVHGDLKPQNMLVERGRVVVLDFGIARLQGTSQARPVGTLAYMAPEQLASDVALTGAADRYAIGVLLHRALSGFLPFVGTGQQIRIAKHGSPPLLGDAPLQILAHALMSPDPNARPDLAAMRRSIERELSASSAPERATGEGDQEVGRAPTIGRSSAARKFVGRSVELARLAGSVAAARVAVLVGSPGLGKTALLDRFCLDHAATVLRSRCYANESIRWNAIDGLVDALLAEGVMATRGLPSELEALARLFPALRTADAAPAPTGDAPVVELVRRAARGFGSLLAGCSRTIVVIDDVQWADADSTAFLVEALRAHAELRLVVATRGPDARSRTIAERLATTGRDVEVIELGPLGDEEAAELAGSLDQAAGMLEHDLISLTTGGVPFLIEELAWAARRRGTGPKDVKDGLSLLSARLAEIDDTSRKLLCFLAVNEAPLEPDILLAAVGDVGQKTVRQLVADRFCRVEQELGSKLERVDVFHDFIRRELLASLPSDARRDAHAALAESTLRAGSGRNDDIARHLFAADDPRAVRYARAAADDARAVFAFDRAAAWLIRVLASPLEAAAARDVRRLLAECRRLAELHADAAQELEALARIEDPHTAIDTRRQAAEQWLTAGDLERGLAILESLYVEGQLDGVGRVRQPMIRLLFERAKVRALGTRGLGGKRAGGRGLEPTRAATPPSPARAQAMSRIDLAWTVSGCFALIDPVRAGTVHATGLLNVLRMGDPERTLRALVGETIYSGLFGASTGARTEQLLAEIERLADTLDSHARGLVASTRSVVEIQRGHFRDGVSSTVIGLDLLLNHPKTVGWELMATRHFYMHALYYLGRYRELCKHVETEYRESNARKNRHRMSDVSLHHATIAWLLSHGPAVARERAEAATTFWSTIGPNVQQYYALASAVTVALWEDDSDRAWRSLAASASATLTAPIFVAEGLRVDALHTVARVATAHVAKHRSVAAASLALGLSALLGAERAPHAAPLAKLQLAGLAGALGATSIAERLAHRAGAALRRQGLLGYAEAAESYREGRTHAGPLVSEPLARVLVPGLATSSS